MKPATPAAPSVWPIFVFTEPSRSDVRRAPMQHTLVSVSGADPLNLAGILLPGGKVPALTGNRVLYRDGAVIAALVGGDVQWLETLDAEQTRIAEDLLIRRQPGSPLLAYLR